MAKSKGYYRDYFCWNCGRRISKGKALCPSCGVSYSGKNKYMASQLILSPENDLRHPSFRRYAGRTMRAYLVWAVGISLLVPLIIKLGGSVDGGGLGWDYVLQVSAIVVPALWIFWIIWVIFTHSGAVRKRRRVMRANALAAGRICCAGCGCGCDRRDNFCTRCGCLLLK